MNRYSKGHVGEDAALEYLISKNFSILARNFKTKTGEIDIIAKSIDKTIVFVEVKSTTGNWDTDPTAHVTKNKMKTIFRVATQYLTIKKLSLESICSFDVIAVWISRVDGESIKNIKHYENAFMV